MEKNFYIIIAVVIIIIAGAWFLMSGNLRQAGVKVENNSASESVEKEVVLVIDSGGGSLNTITSEFKEGMTAFDLLKNETDNSGLNLKTKLYDIGIMVEAIGDKENGQDGRYWLYYVNGEMPMVSADKKEIKAGDKVEFKFEKSPF